jgi:hypothetical protein
MTTWLGVGVSNVSHGEGSFAAVAEVARAVRAARGARRRIEGIRSG